MLKFIEESDFLKVDTFKENEDGSVSWVWDEGEGLPTHSGTIYEGFKRFTQDSEGNDVEIDVWTKLWTLVADNNSPVVVESVDLDLIKANAKQVVNSQRDSLISGGVLHNGNTFQTDATSIMDIMGAIMSGIDTTWLTADNQQVAMTNADMSALGQTVAHHKETLVFKARVHKDNIESLLTKAEVKDYVATMSWE